MHVFLHNIFPWIMKKGSSSQFIICFAVYAYCHTYSVNIMCYYDENESLVIKS